MSINNLFKDKKCCCTYGCFTCWDKNYLICYLFFLLLLCFFIFTSLCISLFAVTWAALEEANKFDETIVSPLDPLVDMFEPNSMKPCYYPIATKKYKGFYECNSK